MNQDLMDLIKTRLTELTEDLLFDFEPDEDSPRAPQIIDTCLPPRSSTYQDGEEYPLVRFADHEGEFRMNSPGSVFVLIDAAIYTKGTIGDGARDIRKLCSAIGRIVDKPWYTPFKLVNPVRCVLGSPEENSKGIQPHPYYFAKLYLEFKVARGHGG